MDLNTTSNSNFDYNQITRQKPDGTWVSTVGNYVYGVGNTPKEARQNLYESLTYLLNKYPYFIELDKENLWYK